MTYDFEKKIAEFMSENDIDFCSMSKGTNCFHIQDDDVDLNEHQSVGVAQRVSHLVAFTQAATGQTRAEAVKSLLALFAQMMSTIEESPEKIVMMIAEALQDAFDADYFFYMTRFGKGSPIQFDNTDAGMALSVEKSKKTKALIHLLDGMGKFTENAEEILESDGGIKNFT